MAYPIYRETRLQIVAPYTLSVTFSDGTQQRIDFKPVLYGALFGPVQDAAMFEQVTLDPEAGTLVWPNGADFDPATLHDWPQVQDELALCIAVGRSQSPGSWCSRSSVPSA